MRFTCSFFKKPATIWLLLVIAGIAAAAIFLILAFAGDRQTLPSQKELIEAYYQDHIGEFCERSDNPESDPEYLAHYDRRIMVENGALTTEYSEDLLTELPAIAPIIRMIMAAEAGDAAAYNACFTASYQQNEGTISSFSPQKLYNIRIMTYTSVSGDRNVYGLSYCIKDNDGSLRRDIVSDVSREMVLTVVREQETYKVASVLYRFSYS